jgi:hypothetical protein
MAPRSRAGRELLRTLDSRQPEADATGVSTGCHRSVIASFRPLITGLRR